MRLLRHTLASAYLLERAGEYSAYTYSTVAATSTVSGIDLTTLITETVNALDALSTGQQDTSAAVSESIVVTDTLLKALIEVAVAESTDTSDSVASIVDLLSTVTETAAATFDIESDLAITASVIVTVAVLAALAAANEDIFLTESTDLADTIADNIAFLLALTETTDTSSTATPVFGAVAVVTSNISATDSLASALAVQGTIAESLNIELVFNLGDDTFVGWVVNSEGMFPSSKYTNWPFNSYAMLGNRVYAMSSSGLYELTGDTDAGSDISAHILTGKTDFGSNLEKQVPEVQIGYTSDGKLRLRAIVYEDSQQEEYWFEMTEVAAPTPITNDIYLGRGLVSSYWQFKLENVDGSDFHIDSMRMYPVVLSRRF